MRSASESISADGTNLFVANEDAGLMSVIDARVINIDQLTLEHFAKGDKFECDAVRIGPRLGAKDLGYSYDVVPPGKGWTRDPFTPAVEGERAVADAHPAGRDDRRG